MEIKRVGSQTCVRGPADWFTGTVRIDPLFEAPEPARVRGLDIDALKTVAHGVNSLRGSKIGILLITHYQRILNYIVPDHVHVMVQGRIVRRGGKELALELEERGYDWARESAAEPAFTR